MSAVKQQTQEGVETLNMVFDHYDTSPSSLFSYSETFTQIFT